jgi:adenylate kinase
LKDGVADGGTPREIFLNIVFLGPPGSGKGTQAKGLAASHGLTHLSTGDIFREAITGQTALGQEIKVYVDAGKLVPDELVSKVVFEKLKSLPKDAGFLLDGYPRTIQQDQFGKRENVGIDAVIFFDVDFAELVKRLSARRSCPQCKEVYNLVNRPPKKENTCDNCGTALMQRPDDRAEIVQDRLNVYTRQTQPILEYYKKRSGFHHVNAAQPIEKVQADIAQALSSKGEPAKGNVV